MREHVQLVSNGYGWRLALRRYSSSTRGLAQGRRPLLFVPGYCMNTSILAFHPRGRSIVEYLADQGWEVWTANLRGQGDSERTNGDHRLSLGAWARVDIPVAVEAVLNGTETGADRVDAIGCSLGGSVWYAHLALFPKDHRVASMVTLGAPLRWDEVHPIVGRTFGWLPEPIVARVHLKGTRAIARRALPIARRVPSLVSVYMNARQVDLSNPDRLAGTVDDPDAHLNLELARWVRERELRVDGLEVRQALRGIRVPVLAVAANRDGIVPPGAVRSIQGTTSSEVTFLEVGNREAWFAHADMFISNQAEHEVFRPIARWLKRWSSA